MYFASLVSSDYSIYNYDFNERRVYRAKVVGEKDVTFIVPIEGCPNQFAINSGRSVKIIKWDGVSEEAYPICEVFNVEPNITENRFNGKSFSTSS